MPVIYIELASNDGGLTPDPKYNVFYADSLGTGLLSEDLHDETLAPTGISLSEGAAPFTDSGRSASNADSSPDARLDVEFFRGHFFKGGNGEKFVLGNFPPGHPYTLEPAGQTGSGRETVFSATNSSPASATYTPDSTDPKDAPQPPVMTGTADASGFIAVGADFVTLYPYMNGFILSYEAFTAPTITDINTNNEVIPGTTATLTGTNLTGATGLNIGSQAQADFTVVSDTEVTFTGTRGGNPYNQDLTATLLSPDGNATITVQQVPASGRFAVTAANPNTEDDASLWSGLVDTATGDPVTVVDGDQALVKSGPAGVAVDPDGTITADETGDLVVQFWRQSEGVWGSDQTVSFVVPGGGTVTIGASLRPRRIGSRQAVRPAVNQAAYQAIYRS